MSVPSWYQEYVALKRKAGDAILFLRLGDFYETFADDAILCAKLLGLSLVVHGKHGDHPLPLAGIPCRSFSRYRAALVRDGHRVAVSEARR